MLQSPLIGPTVAVAALAALSVGFSWAFAMKWGRPKRRLTTRTPSDYALRAESVTFGTRNGELTGWFIPPDHPDFPTVVVSHGWGSDAARMLPLAAMLHDKGFAVLLYDARGHGANNAPGPITLLTFAEDVTAAIDHLNQRLDVDPKRLGVIGHSMGGAAAIVAASTDPRIRAVVSSSAFAHPVTLTRRTLRHLHIPLWPFLPLIRYFVEHYLGTTMTDIAPQNRIADIAVPVLLLHGVDDDLVPATDMETLYNAANHTTTSHISLPGRAHRDILIDSEYSTQTVHFLNETLTPQTTSAAT